ncbi:MAG: zinc ribbon domain-containing protein [Acidimicrobiia bacterium]|nr:zinc ribbon domain-containing protein [Acidimicrobiia bacterium]
MPLYEYRCPECETTFEARRPMAEASEPIDCPEGHVGSRRLLSVFASTGAASAVGGAPAPASRPSGGGCCGGMCG